jgi:phosphatidylglycerol:prolipoprotein diacylglycerol transferase
MYPNPIFLGLTLYDICLCAGIVACFAIFGTFADKLGIKVRVQKLAIVCGVCGVILGYGAAVLFQALYNIKTLGKFEISASTGATFYGGLVGGAAVFLIMYFALGGFATEDGAHKRQFFSVADCAVTGITLAHALGRIGCLTAGCCHGQLTDAWYGIEMYGNFGYDKYVPTQLFEAIFLLLLFAFLTLRVFERSGYNLPIYLIAYGIWRFAIEKLRADYRGDTIVEWLTPSQLVALILVLVGVGVIFIEKECKKRFCAVCEHPIVEESDD